MRSARCYTKRLASRNFKGSVRDIPKTIRCPRAKIRQPSPKAQFLLIPRINVSIWFSWIGSLLLGSLRKRWRNSNLWKCSAFEKGRRRCRGKRGSGKTHKRDDSSHQNLKGDKNQEVMLQKIDKDHGWQMNISNHSRLNDGYPRNSRSISSCSENMGPLGEFPPREVNIHSLPRRDSTPRGLILCAK